MKFPISKTMVFSLLISLGLAQNSPDAYSKIVKVYGSMSQGLITEDRYEHSYLVKTVAAMGGLSVSLALAPITLGISAGVGLAASGGFLSYNGLKYYKHKKDKLPILFPNSAIYWNEKEQIEAAKEYAEKKNLCQGGEVKKVFLTTLTIGTRVIDLDRVETLEKESDLKNLVSIVPKFENKKEKKNVDAKKKIAKKKIYVIDKLYCDIPENKQGSEVPAPPSAVSSVERKWFNPFESIQIGPNVSFEIGRQSEKSASEPGSRRESFQSVSPQPGSPGRSIRSTPEGNRRLSRASSAE